MSISIRIADPADQIAMVDLLLQDAQERHALDAMLWALKGNARDSIMSALKCAMEAENPPFRQQWLVAEVGGEIVGLTHSILLPVPPIYAGENGAPGLIMEDCFVVDGAPVGTAEALLATAEQDLRDAGAKVLLGSSVSGGAWGKIFSAQDYAPLTLYLAKSGLAQRKALGSARAAADEDVPTIVALSAEHRRILNEIDIFWKPHVEADVRFGNWMARSLTLSDRDMFVSGAEGVVAGYSISQPATPLHFPAAHEISATGVIDDFYHVAFGDLEVLSDADGSALDVLTAADSALAARGRGACIVVCPAGWTSKIALLESSGYETAITWYIKQ